MTADEYRAIAEKALAEDEAPLPRRQPNAPVEGKVSAASIGAGAGLTLAEFLRWGLGVLVWGAPSDAGHAADAVAAVPAPVSAMLLLGITVGGAFLNGYRARHTPR